MREIKIFLDRNKQQEVKESIKFKGVVAGEKTIGEVFLFNNLNYYMDVSLEIIGESVKILKEIKYLSPMELKKVEFEFTPKITTMKPIKAKLKIKISYLII